MGDGWMDRWTPAPEHRARPGLGSQLYGGTAITRLCCCSAVTLTQRAQLRRGRQRRGRPWNNERKDAFRPRIQSNPIQSTPRLPERLKTRTKR